MLREYQKGDELLLNCNQFSMAVDVKECLEGGRYKAKTFEKNGNILCIVVFLQYVQYHYATFSLVSRDIKFGELKELKRAIQKAAKDAGAKTFLTFCSKNGKLDRWHEFMGFEKSRQALSGKVKNMTKWILKWDGKH